MHILFLTDHFPPEVSAPSGRILEHCREWVAAGHRVTVITNVPNYPRGRIYPGYRNWPWQRESVDGIEVIRVWTYVAANEGFARRAVDQLSYMVSAATAATFVRPVSVVVGSSPPLFAACAARIAAAIARRPWVFEVRDIWPESIRAVGALGRSSLLDLLERLEMSLYRSAGAIICVTEMSRQNLVDRGVLRAKVEVVTNGVDLSLFTPRPKDRELEAEFGLTGKFVAGYIGTHGMAHALGTVLDAARIAAADPEMRDIQFLLVGDGAEKTGLIARARDERLDNVTFLDPVPKDQVARYWALLDVSIIHLRASPLFKTVIPSKLFECMAMGLPVLHGVEGESAGIVEREDIGLLFRPEDADALVGALRTLLQDERLRERLRQNGPGAAAKFERTALAQRMLEIMQRLE